MSVEASQSHLPFFGLIILAVAVIINVLLATIVYRSNSKSVTTKIFLLLSAFTSAWLIVSYIVRFPIFNSGALLLARFGIFFAAPISTLFFLLAHTVPYEKLRLSNKKFVLVVLMTILMMGLNISPYGFTEAVVVEGTIQPKPGAGFIPFAVISTAFSVLAVYFLVRRYADASGEERQQLRSILVGLSLMLVLVIGTVLIPIIFLKSGFFVSLTPVYALIFFGMTAYAIVKHHLFNTKVIATEALIVLICVLLLSRVLITESVADQVANILIFAITIFLGILLTRSVKKEVEQREKLEVVTKELGEANAKLKELDKLKSEFLSFASHQVKAPMAAVKGFASLIYDGTYGAVSDQVKETAKKIKDSADRMIALVNNILNLRKIEEGRMEYNLEDNDVVKLIKNITDELKNLAESKHLQLIMEEGPAEAVINMDTEKLRQVFQNLIENAIKYTESGTVTVGLEKTAGHLFVRIKDSGRGMSPDLLSRLFERFARDGEAAKKIEGTGLGLYIAKQLVLGHKGEIWAESEGEGKGSVFIVKLPSGKN